MRVAVTIPPPGHVTTGPLLPATTEDEQLLDALVRRDAHDVILGSRSDARTDDGWPFTIQRARTAAGERVAALYRFGAWRGYVLVEVADVAHVSQIEDALRGAEPDWRGDGEVHCIAELFT